MNTKDIIVQVSKKLGVTQTEAKKGVDAILEALTSGLRNQEEIRISGFGTFSSKLRAATTGRNPRTGETIEIPERLQAKFRPSKELKDSINN